MTSDCYVLTQAIREAVKGQETTVLAALGIAWQDGAPHISCPYHDHSDGNPSWRWNERKAKAYCTCVTRRGGHSILDVVMHVERLEFDAAKLRVAEILGRHDLINVRDGERRHAMDAASLLRPPSDQRDDELARAYLAHRLGVSPDQVPMPSTPAVGWRELPYYDPPQVKNGRAKLVGRYPCVVFATVAPDGRPHAHRIHVAADGAKADLGVGRDGRARDPKKSARLKKGQSASGCVALWGDPASVPHLLLAEGIETSGALALAHRAEIGAGELAVAAALSTSGIRTFVPWPATRIVTIAADRDEAKPEHDRGFKAGEKAARSFARAHHKRFEIRIVLPGEGGEDIDWLDALRSAGPEAVRAAIAAAHLFEPSADDGSKPDDAYARAPTDEENIEGTLREIVDRASSRSERAVRARGAVRACRGPPGRSAGLSACDQAS